MRQNAKSISTSDGEKCDSLLSRIRHFIGIDTIVSQMEFRESLDQLGKRSYRGKKYSTGTVLVDRLCSNGITEDTPHVTKEFEIRNREVIRQIKELFAFIAEVLERAVFICFIYFI